jgi:cytochrome c556
MMTRVSVFIAICFILACALSLTGQSQQNQNALKNIMKQVDPAWTSLQKNVDSGNVAGVATDAARLQRLFDAADRFFAKMNMEKAAGWAKEEAAAAGTAAKAAKDGTIDKNAKTAIGKCKQCHDVYRQKNQDGSFSLKRD